MANTEHTSKQFDAELEAVRARVLQMGGLVEEQIKGSKELNFDPKKGEVKAPWLSWGPYLWANGKTKNADGLFYEIDDKFWIGDDGYTRLGNSDIGWDYDPGKRPGADNPVSYHNNMVPKSR